jgi:protein O-mannosyl-transferase
MFNKKAVLIIVVIGVLTFLNTLFNNFIWDDNIFIIRNPQIHSFNIINLFGNNMFNNNGYYRPIPAVYFSALYSLFTTHQFFYHIIQIVLHIINTILVFILFRKFFIEKLSLFLSLIFLVHPIQVESVSYIASVGSELFFLFGILALNLAQKDLKNIHDKFGIFIFLFLSFLSKETGILFFLVIIFYLYLFNRKNVKSFFLPGLASIFLYLIFRFMIGGVRFTLQKYIPIMTLSFSQRALNIPQIILYYLKTFFFPLNLAINQTWMITTITFYNFFLPLIFIFLFISITIIVYIYLYRKKRKAFKPFIFFLFWLSIGIASHAQLIPLDFTVADRWFYFPIIGIIGIIGICINELHKYIKTPQFVTLILGIIIIGVLMTRTIIRNTDWKDAFTLYSHDVKFTQSVFLENDLGIEYMTRGQNELALNHLQQSVKILPFETNLFNTGLIYAKKQDLIHAKIYFKQAVEQYKGYVSIPILARLLLVYNDPENAEILLQKGLEEKPLDIQLLLYSTVAEYNMKHKQKALEIAQKAYILSPNENTTYLLNQISNNLPIEIK